MPPRVTDSVLSEDFLPVSHPEVSRTEGRHLSLLPAQLQPMQTLKSYERNVPDVTVRVCVLCRVPTRSVSLAGRVE